MKLKFLNQILLLLMATLSSGAMAQNCSPGGLVTLSTQAKVDSFQQDFGPCDHVNGKLVISGPDIENLDGMQGIVTTFGDVDITGNPILTNLTGLSSLERVGNSLNITNNPELTDLSGLSSLHTVRFIFELARNESLTHLTGLEALESMTVFNIRANPVLEDITSLKSLNGEKLTLRFYGNPALSDLQGLEYLAELRDLWLQGTALTALTGLSGLKDVHWDLNIQINPYLTSLNGLSSIESVGRRLGIVQNSELEDLSALLSVSQVGTDLVIGSNPSLVDLDGLSSIKGVGGDLLIIENLSLASCSGIRDLLDRMDHGEPGPGPAGVPDIGGGVRIEDNLPGCNSWLEILDPNASPFSINPGLNDAWYNDATDGQGFFITVYPETNIMFLGWFTFESDDRPGENPPAELGEPFHRWLTAQGNWQSNKATLDVTKTFGGLFDDGQAVTNSPDGSYGEIIIVFHSCTTATLSYELFGKAQGVIPITRIVPDNGSICENFAKYY